MSMADARCEPTSGSGVAPESADRWFGRAVMDVAARKETGAGEAQDRGQGEDRQWYGGPDASFFAGKPFRFSGIRGVTGTHRGVRDRTKEQGGVEQRDAVAAGPPRKVSGRNGRVPRSNSGCNPHAAKSSWVQWTHFEGGGGSARIKSLVLRHSE